MRDRGKTFDAAMLPCGRAVTDLRKFERTKAAWVPGEGRREGHGGSLVATTGGTRSASAYNRWHACFKTLENIGYAL